MPLDRAFVEKNRAATDRVRSLTARLSDADMQRPVGEHWTVGIALVHLAFWDRRVLLILEISEAAGKLVTPVVDVTVNDISLPLWAVISPRDAARLSVETAETLDRRLESCAPPLLEELYSFNQRWVERFLHRNEHLDEVDEALKG